MAVWLLRSFKSIKDNILNQNTNGTFSENQCRLCTSSLVKKSQLPHCVIEWFYYLINYHTLNCSLKGTENWIATDVSLKDNNCDTPTSQCRRNTFVSIFLYFLCQGPRMHDFPVSYYIAICPKLIDLI